jgi:hypothetical protein
MIKSFAKAILALFGLFSLFIMFCALVLFVKISVMMFIMSAFVIIMLIAWWAIDIVVKNKFSNN